MTQLIDLTFQQHNTDTTRINPRYKLTSSASRQTPHYQERKDQNHLQFIYQTQQFQFHFLFSIFTQNSSLIINVFLLNSNFQIFKIHSTLETSLILNSYLKHPNLYQPNIDPSTGFVYFKVSYFDYKKWKGGGNYRNSFNTNQIFKLFNIQKLKKSALKLSESGLKLEDDHLSSSIWNDQKSYLQMSKFISKLTEKNDFQQIINKKITEKNHDKFKMAENSMFVKTLTTIITSNPQREFHISSFKLQNLMTSLTQDYTKLLNLVKSKTIRSNYETLLINQTTTKKLNSLLSIIVYQRQNSPVEIFKALDAQLGKISIQLSFENERKFNQKIAFLKLLPKNTEYHFLDKYFKSGINVPILLKLSLKDESLGNFLENNRKTMSLETKVRLMLQLYSAVTTLWQENKILLCVNQIGSIFITKNLTVKLRGLDSWYRPQHHVLLEGKNEVNQKITENLLNLTKIYYKIFFNHTMIYIRPAIQTCVESSLMDYCRIKRILQNLRHPSIMQSELNGKALKQFFSGLGYLFGEYIELGRKIIQEQKRKRLQRDKFIVKKSEKNNIQEQHDRRRQYHFDYDSRLLNHKYFCSWLFKVLEGITKEIQ